PFRNGNKYVRDKFVFAQKSGIIKDSVQDLPIRCLYQLAEVMETLMGVSYFITITSQNHSGVLTAITTALGELGGDMHHASQSIVHGLFTMTIAAKFPDHRSIQVIQEHLLQVGRNYEMAVLVRELLEDEADVISTDSTYYLTVNGQDAPG
ncbi:MAG TPA: hypothetical protein DD473_26310, partial [Planctomycetaceae bacterium]|nr:hypothetical protein [Planctomycetaceae bacterium]